MGMIIVPTSRFIVKGKSSNVYQVLSRMLTPESVLSTNVSFYSS